MPTELLVVALIDCLDRGLELGLVDADHDKRAEVKGVNIWVREQTRPREVLLNVGFVWQMWSNLLEDHVVQRKAVAKFPHHFEMVEHATRLHEWLEQLGRQVGMYSTTSARGLKYRYGKFCLLMKNNTVQSRG